MLDIGTPFGPGNNKEDSKQWNLKQMVHIGPLREIWCFRTVSQLTIFLLLSPVKAGPCA
jgi:hypothetical protein